MLEENSIISKSTNAVPNTPEFEKSHSSGRPDTKANERNAGFYYPNESMFLKRNLKR